MINQTVLPFKLEETKDLITAHAGLALLGEFSVGLGVLDELDKALPQPGSGAGYLPSEHVFPNRIVGYTLDIDATGIEAEKESARMTYKGYPGYMPMVGHLAENGLVLGDEFREGNNAPAARNLEFICMNETKEAFRLVVIRRPVQGKLFGEEGETERYTAVATNRTEGLEQVIKWYNQRGQCSENRIKELKIGFGMERMPCGQFEANAVFFRIGVLSYNVGRLFVLKTLGIGWHRHQVQTLRWKLYETAGKIVFHGRNVWLKVSRHLNELFSRIRTSIWEFASS